MVYGFFHSKGNMLVLHVSAKKRTRRKMKLVYNNKTNGWFSNWAFTYSKAIFLCSNLEFIDQNNKFPSFHKTLKTSFVLTKWGPQTWPGSTHTSVKFSLQHRHNEESVSNPSLQLPSEVLAVMDNAQVLKTASTKSWSISPIVFFYSFSLPSAFRVSKNRFPSCRRSCRHQHNHIPAL